MSVRVSIWGARLALACALVPASAGIDLKPDTSAAFERYVRQAEARIRMQVSSGEGFFFASSPERRATLRRGGIVTEAVIPHGERRAPSGLIHDWAGAVFIPNTTVETVLQHVQSYDRHQEFYGPEVIRSRLLFHEGQEFRAGLRLLKRKALAVVVLDTEHGIRYEQVDPYRWWALSHSTRIAEIENAGTPSERALRPDTGHGYLWRLNSYWSFQQLDGGTYVEIEAISLTRDVPGGLRLLLNPIIRALPKESLFNTLRATRDAVAPRRRP